jgi:hypothetical protein
MVQVRQDLALNFEPRVHSAGGHTAVHYFDGHLLLEFGIRPLGKENLAHTADTQSAQHAIMPDAVAYHLRSMHLGAGEPQTSTALAVECCLRVCKQRSIEKIRSGIHMANGQDPSKPPLNPGSGTGTGSTGTGTGGTGAGGTGTGTTGTGSGISPQNSNKPPQNAVVAVAAAVGGAIGGLVGALIGSGMHH